MPRQDEAAELLRQGLPPTEIARRMGTSASAVMHYLCLKIGQGGLRRSDIAFSLPRPTREQIERVIEETGSLSAAVIVRQLQKRQVSASRFDIGVYVQYRRARVVLGDMYELLRDVEVSLHIFVRNAFVQEFGEDQWWRNGVPDTIRAECAALLEKDPEPADEAYCYTHLIALREILDKRWSVLSKYLPPRLLNRKKDLMERLLRLNRIRNGVMHPVRNAVLTEDDFEFVRDLAKELSGLDAHLRDEQAAPTGPVADAEAAHPRELVSRLTLLTEDQPAAEEASTPLQAESPQDFIPSTKVE